MAKSQPSTDSALKPYQAKRKFDRTPEPAGDTKKPAEKANNQLRFVVQKHEASRLHYDFRLELGGVLKSWAIPKGPSLNPDDKHLAILVEDHPFDYRTFEGTIPEGNYGAGTVMVWDEGTYRTYDDGSKEEQEKTMRAGLHKGHLTFILSGKKLKGEFALIKIHDSDDENAWLLVKKGDEYASTKDVLNEDRSAVTGRTMGEIADQSDQVWHSNRREPTKQEKSFLKVLLAGAPEAPFPGFVKPMMATLAKAPFDDPDWLFEIKWDGYRIEALVNDDKVELMTRNEQDYTKEFQPIADELSGFGHSAILDGEVVVLDEAGRSRFQLLQDYRKTGKGELVYYVFDILHLDGHDLTGLELDKRKEILEAVLSNLDHVRLSDHIEERGKDFFAAATGQKLEGIMAKQKQSPYLVGKRTAYWLKLKGHQRQEAVIGGYTEPRSGRKYFGALILGVYKNGKFVYIGHAGGGFDDKDLKSLYEQLKQVETDECPFDPRPKTNAPAHWVKPELLCEVEFSEWTSDGQMRQPIFVGLREDKDPKEVVRELPQAEVKEKEVNMEKPPKVEKSKKASKAADDQEIVIAGHNLKLTHLDKVYFPEDGYTKGDLINYYRDIAKTMMPYLGDRPVSLNRHPNGIHGPSFYQKDLEKHPDWVRTIPIHSDSEDKIINYFVAEDEASLIYMANLGCIEINPWSSRTKAIDNPDWCIIDLDPEDVDFETVIKVAQGVHKVLEAAAIPAYAKTSGATGIHVYIPLGAKYTYDQSKDFAHIIAKLANAQMPDITSVERNPAKRRQRVYLDYLQNRRGQTLAAPYSVRPRPGAPVSTPLEWKEVKKGLHPSQFTIQTMPKRLAKIGDIWKPVNGKGIDMHKALTKLAG